MNFGVCLMNEFLRRFFLLQCRVRKAAQWSPFVVLGCAFGLSLRSWQNFLRAACRTNRAFYRSHRRSLSLRPPISNGSLPGHRNVASCFSYACSTILIPRITIRIQYPIGTSPAKRLTSSAGGGIVWAGLAGDIVVASTIGIFAAWLIARLRGHFRPGNEPSTVFPNATTGRSGDGCKAGSPTKNGVCGEVDCKGQNGLSAALVRYRHFIGSEAPAPAILVLTDFGGTSSATTSPGGFVLATILNSPERGGA
jgi:hypothetical protein